MARAGPLKSNNNVMYVGMLFTDLRMIIIYFCGLQTDMKLNVWCDSKGLSTAGGQ